VQWENARFSLDDPAKIAQLNENMEAAQGITSFDAPRDDLAPAVRELAACVDRTAKPRADGPYQAHARLGPVRALRASQSNSAAPRG